MAVTRWLVELRYRGELRHEIRRSAVVVGEGGDVVIPGLGGTHLLACGDLVTRVTGLEAVGSEIADEGRVLGVDECIVLRVTEHPEIELTLARERIEPLAISRTPMLPWREAVYGLTFAACVSAFISVKVAVSPVRDREQEDREVARELLVDVPIAFVVPPPIVQSVAGGAPEEPANDDVVVADDTRVVEAPEVSEVAQPDPEALPKPKARRKPKLDAHDELYDTGVASILGSADDNALGELIGMSPTASLLAADDESVDLATKELLIDRIVEPSEITEGFVGGVAGGVPGGVVGGIEPSEAATSVDGATEGANEGGDAAKTCAMEADPKDRIDIVFVVDVSAPMPKTLWHLAQQIDRLHRRVADKHPRYGVVAFADDVEMVRLDALTTLELRTALLALSDDAKGRGPDADVRDDVLGALDRAREFPWGDTRDTLRMIVLVTDNDYGDRGEKLGEHTVGHSHARVAEQLADDSIRVSTITRQRVPGLDRERNGHASLPVATAGVALRESVVYPEDGLVDALDELLDNPVCRKNLADVVVGE